MSLIFLQVCTTSKISIWYYVLNDFSLAGYEAFVYLNMILVAIK